MAGPPEPGRRGPLRVGRHLAGDAGEDAVLLLDDDPVRRQELAARLAPDLTACGRLVTRPLSDLASPAGGLHRLLTALGRASASAGGSIAALVAVAAPQASCPNAGMLAGLRALADAGLPSVAYADGSAAWTLASRCRVLLSGACHVADSGASRFAADVERRLRELLQAMNARRAEERELFEAMAGVGLLGRSRAMMETFRAITRASCLSDFPALVTGETGTGKELVARALHRLDKKRGRGPFVPVNCAALPKSLAESELFGHRRGAFSGAERARRGLVRAADGGVLFLDEIGDLDLDLQAKLLRVLQEGRVLVVGEDEEVPVSVRVVAATHRNLESMVERGQFREDLWHRLSALPVRVPPLRERRDDIALLAGHIVARNAALIGRRELPSIGGDFIEALASADLRGNVRQLENLIRGALAARMDSAPLGLGDLPPEMWREISATEAPTDVRVAARVEGAPAPVGPRSELATGVEMSDNAAGGGWPASSAHLLATHDWNLARALESCERLLLMEAISCHRGNQTRVAQVLGITPRSVYNKLRRHQIKLG